MGLLLLPSAALAKASVIVAVIDSGADVTHPALRGHLWTAPDGSHGADFVDRTRSLQDTSGHGTMVAGIIAGGGVAGSPFAGGVDPAARLMILKVSRPTTGIDFNAAAAAVNYAVAKGARIINMSWGGRFASVVLAQALTRASAAGVLLVTAAGNDGIDLRNYYPADYRLPTEITVAASCDGKTLADFSSYDKLYVGLAAFGCNVSGPVPGDNQFSAESGTSFAASEVAGAAALLWSRHPKLSAVAVRRALLAGATFSPALDAGVWSGGMLNERGAEAALAARDTSAPGPFRVISPGDGRFVSDGTNPIDFNWTPASDPHLSGYEVLIDNMPYLAFASTATSGSVLTTPGPHTYKIIAFDRFGNATAGL